MLRIVDLEVGYGKIQALWGISFEIPEGEIVAVVGANGAGKTTTLKTLSGLLRPRAGRILLDDHRLDGLSPARIVELGVVHVPEGRKLFPEMTVLAEMFRVIGEINRAGVTVLLVEQNTEHALALAHRGFVLESGRVALSGTGSELLASARVREAYLGL